MKRATQKLHRNGHSIVCTVPADILEALNWKFGTEIYVEEIAGCVVILSLDHLVRDRLAALQSRLNARGVEPSAA